VLIERHRPLACLAQINPNVLTFLGLVVNTIAAFLFGYANGDNQARISVRRTGHHRLRFLRPGRRTCGPGQQPGDPLRRFLRILLLTATATLLIFGLLCLRRGDASSTCADCVRDGQRHHGQLQRARAERSSVPAVWLHGAPRTPVLVINRGPV